MHYCITPLLVKYIFVEIQSNSLHKVLRERKKCNFFVGIGKKYPFLIFHNRSDLWNTKNSIIQTHFCGVFPKNNAHYFPNFCNNALLHYLILKSNALLHISRKSNAIMKCITAIMHYWKSANCSGSLPLGACTNHVDKRGGRGGCSDDHNT